MEQLHIEINQMILFLLQQRDDIYIVEIISGNYMAKTILNSILHEREHYSVSVRSIALVLEQRDCNNAIGRTRAQ